MTVEGSWLTPRQLVVGRLKCDGIPAALRILVHARGLSTAYICCNDRTSANARAINFVALGSLVLRIAQAIETATEELYSKTLHFELMSKSTAILCALARRQIRRWMHHLCHNVST